MAVIAKIPAKVIEVIKHTDSVGTIILEPQKKCPNFKPGQFLHLAIDHYDPSFQWPESRVFSIANSPTRKENIRITFIVKGIFTRRMYSQIKEDDTIWLKLPYGKFTYSGDGKHIVLIAGGTGITPFISFLEYMIDNRIEYKIKLYYGVRSEELLLFEELISECESSLPLFNKSIYLEQENNINDKFRKGRLNIEKILNETEDKKNTVFYLSGPIDMVNNFKSYLNNNNINEHQIRIDEWE